MRLPRIAHITDVLTLGSSYKGQMDDGEGMTVSLQGMQDGVQTDRVSVPRNARAIARALISSLFHEIWWPWQESNLRPMV